MAENTFGIESWADLDQVAAQLLVDGVTEEKVTSVYNEWAKNGYDQIFREQVGPKYGALRELKTAMEECFPADSRAGTVLLEIGAGTGISGEVVKDLGFPIIDGLDPAADMLRVAEGRKIFRHHYTCPFTAKPLDIPADTYDGIFMAGVVTPGAVKCEAFNEMVRLVKPGGYVINCMRAAYLQEIEDYAQNWEPLVGRLEKEGKWKVMEMRGYADHFMGNDGLCMVIQVL